jgi:hypothetical protein
MDKHYGIGRPSPDDTCLRMKAWLMLVVVTINFQDRSLTSGERLCNASRAV